MAEYMITTQDNPYNPSTQFDLWRAYDISKGYYTLEYLARIAVVSDDLPKKEYDKAVEDAIDEILRLNLLGIYKKVEIK